MKITIQKLVNQQLNITGVSILIPEEDVEHVRHGNDKILPSCFKQPSGDYLLKITAEGRIEGWSDDGIRVFYKLRDSGVFTLFVNDLPYCKLSDYVPDFLSMGEGGGDYLDLDISDTGFIQGWTDAFNEENISGLLSVIVDEENEVYGLKFL